MVQQSAVLGAAEVAHSRAAGTPYQRRAYARAAWHAHLFLSPGDAAREQEQPERAQLSQRYSQTLFEEKTSSGTFWQSTTKMAAVPEICTAPPVPVPYSGNLSARSE